MQKRFALLLVVLIVVLAIVPSSFPRDDDAFRQNSPLSDVSLALLTVAVSPFEVDLYHDGPGIPLSLEIFYSLPQDVISPTVARAPPV